MGAGIALGPLLTGVLDLAGAWRWFYVGLALAGTLLYALAGRVVEGVRKRGQRWHTGTVADQRTEMIASWLGTSCPMTG